MRRFLLLAIGVAFGGCSCGTTPPAMCASSTDCAHGLVCRDGMCVAPTDGGPVTDAAMEAGPVDGGGTTCGATTCVVGEICGTNLMCCARSVLCGSTCCTTGQVCEGAVCKLDCGAQTRCENDATGTAACCASGEVCASGACFMPTTACRDFVDCPAGEYCEPTLGMCLPQPTGTPCVTHPSGGAVVPTELWHWDGTGRALADYDQVMMAPIVVNLNDDDGDGHVDERDIPDVAFTTFCGTHSGACTYGNYGEDGVMRAISGDDGHVIFDVTDPAHRVNPGAQLAAGDIDGDGLVEIVACGSAPGGIGPIVAFENDGTFKWASTDPRVQCAEAAPSIADLDGDGHPEVFVRYTVLHGADGTIAWHHDCVGTGGWATSSHNPCDYTTAADLDHDAAGTLEVVGGNIAYHADGTVYYDRTADFNDGYPAIGDLNRDGSPEVVVVESAFHPTPYAGDHFLRALDSHGADYWPAPVDINQGRAPAADVAADTVGGGGPPTIANFDDDPEPEIALAGAYAYAVFEPDGTSKWTAVSSDRSSRKTGSSVFDFDGDGAAEAVYNDEYFLRVYDGRTGAVRFCQCNTSATLWEYPVIVDVNRDGHAEIVVAENDYAGWDCTTSPVSDSCTTALVAAGATANGHGIRVFASPTHDWVATRHIWNEHTYHVTNVTEAGAIPAHETRNWTVGALNDFRTNVQPGALNIPNLVPIDLGVELAMCPSTMTLDFRVKNIGWAASVAGVPVSVYADGGTGTFTHVARVTTTRALLPGESEPFSVPYDITAVPAGGTVTFRVVVDDGADMPLPTLVECDATDNTDTTMASCVIFG